MNKTFKDLDVKPYQTMPRGLIGNSLVAYLCNINNANVIEYLNTDDYKDIFENVPEFDHNLIIEISNEAKPKSFDDLVKITSLAHGTNAWKDNAEILINNGTSNLSEIVSNRDDLFDVLVNHNVSKNEAYEIMEDVRKGKDIKYQFNAIEVIWLINNAYDLSFEERKKAYYDIIDNFADMSYMNSFDGNEYDSVQQIVIEYVALIEPIEEEKRTLITISNYMKEKIDLGLAFNAYNQIISDEHAKKLKKQTWYTKAGYIDSGMENDPNVHIKIWLDDERPAPGGYVHCHSVNEVISKITQCEYERVYIDLLDLDHDLGEYAKDGGDGIKLLDWLAETKKFYPIKLHTMNPVGRENMQREIDRYWPKN